MRIFIYHLFFTKIVYYSDLKTKSLITGIFLYLINSSIALSQEVDYKSINNSPQVQGDTNTIQPAPLLKPSAFSMNTDTIIQIDSLRSVEFTKDSLGHTIIKKKQKEQVITSKIEYNADDSTIFSVDGQKIFLFGNAFIKYDDIQLNAAYIEADLSQNIIYAEGVPDSLGNLAGQPVFTQGSEVIKSKTITYNIKTGKGYINGLITEQSDGYLHSQTTKKEPNNEVNLYRGKYTTCDLDDPHFYLFLTKGKVVPGKVIVAGLSYLVIEDVPLYPLMIPFGFFPNTKEKTSGFLIPKFGEEKNRGFYLTNGGYYFALSDYADLAIKGDIYSKGSWQMTGQSKYKLRYKFSGNVDVGYSKVISSEPGLANYNESNEYHIRWTHTQDAKARPNSNFGASVNFSSMGNSKYNSTTTNDYLSNTTSSSISYRKTFANTPFSTSVNLKHSQNTRDSIINMTLPQMTWTMSRIFPFRSKNSSGKTSWYENIGVTYSGDFQNTIRAKDSVLFSPEAKSLFKNGVKHSIPLSTSIKVLKYFNLSPSMSYTERWYFKKIDKSYDTVTKVATYDTIPGFNRVYDYSYSAGFGTTIYGMYQFKGNWLKAIRHVATPSVSFSYRPDFGQDKWGYYKQDPQDSSKLYSYFNDGIYGIPGYGKSGAVSFSLNNNVEMKVANKKDTVNNETKIKLLESLSFSTNYNMIAQNFKWAPVSMSARTTLFKVLSINGSATGDLYALNSKGTRVDTFNYKQTGRLMRITSARASTGFNINSKKLFGGGDEGKETQKIKPTEDEYDYFDVPWNLRVDYSLNYTKSGFVPDMTQTLGFSGDFSLTPKWKIGFRSGWDFKAKDFSYTSFNISRDLHCWMASVTLIPFGQRQSYSFTIGVKSSILQDLKYNKSKSWYDNYAY